MFYHTRLNPIQIEDQPEPKKEEIKIPKYTKSKKDTKEE